MALTNNKKDNKFVSILSDGTIRLPAEAEAEGAIKRTYETSDGKTGEKWEYVYTELTGLITKLSFYEGDYGKLLQIKVEDGSDKPIILSVGTETPFGEDIMKKLPAIDLTKPVKFVPFSFETEAGKKKRGVTIYQNVGDADVKINNYYYDPEKKQNTNGYPDPELKKGKKPTKEEWKLYFMKARLFLIEETAKRFCADEIKDNDDELDSFVEDAVKALEK
jgi:hypothetical protein